MFNGDALWLNDPQTKKSVKKFLIIDVNEKKGEVFHSICLQWILLVVCV